MGTDTHIFLENIEVKQIEKFLKGIGKNIKLENTIFDNYSTISFQYKEEHRTLHIHKYHTILSKEKEHFEREGWEWKESSSEVLDRIMDGLPSGIKGSYCSIGYWGSNLEIMRSLCWRFGGYLDKSDSDSEGYYKIEKNYKKIINVIFR